MDQRADAPSLVLDGRQRPPRLDLVERPPLEVDVQPALGQPVRKADGRIVERAAERRVQLLRARILGDVDEQAADARPREARPHESGEEEVRNRDERERGEQLEHAGKAARPGIDGERDREQDHRRAAGEIDRTEHPPPGRRRAAPAPYQERDDGSGEHDAAQIRRDLDRSRGSIAARDEEDIRRTVLAIRDRRRVDEQREHVREHCDPVRAVDDRPLETR